MRLRTSALVSVLLFSAGCQASNEPSVPLASEWGSAPPPTAGPGSASGLIAFHADPGGDSGLYVTNADGSGVRLVSGSLSGHPFAQWSPDGSELAFLSGSSGVGRPKIVGVDGSGERSVGSGQATALSWSPDGTRLAYEDVALGGLWVIDADGAAPPQQLTASGHQAEWSPDGNWILFVDGPEGSTSIYRISTSGGTADQLTADGNNFSARSSPDGSMIAFTSSRDGNLELYLMAADGSDLRRLTSDPAPDDEARWSPDGASLVYVSFRSGADPQSLGIGDAEVYTVDVATGTSRAISNDPAWDGDPAWSPDGAWIVFTRRTDHGELHVMRPDGSDQRALPGFGSPEFNDCCPVWQPSPP